MDSNYLVKLAAEACDDRKAKDIHMINVEEVTTLTDWIVITEGLSDVQVRAIVKSVEDKLASDANRLPIRKEGINEAKWALLDYGDMIINVFQSNERAYYKLEDFWSNGKIIKYEQNNNI